MRNGWAIIYGSGGGLEEFFIAASRSAKKCIAHMDFLATERCGELSRSALVELDEWELEELIEIFE